MALTENDYMEKQAASLAGQINYSQKLSPPKETAPILEVETCFKQAHELSSYVHSIVDRLIGAVPSEQDAKGTNYLGSPGLLPELVDNSRRARQAMQDAMGALRRLESQLP